MNKEELVKFALDKGYILEYNLYDSTDSFDKKGNYRIFPITIKGDNYIIDSLASPSIYESGVMEILIKETIINWLNNTKEITIPEIIKKSYLDNLYSKDKKYKLLNNLN